MVPKCSSESKLCFGLFSLCLSIVLVGCSESEPGPTGPQASVGGTITYEEKPIPSGCSVVFFHPAESVTASGKTDDLGKYSLSPSVASAGIPPGKYQVMIRPPEVPQPVVGTKEYEDAMTGKTKKPGPPKEVPVQFHAFITSRIDVEMKAGPNSFDFDLAKLETKK